jgi:hypothetical protein
MHTLVSESIFCTFIWLTSHPNDVRTYQLGLVFPCDRKLCSQLPKPYHNKALSIANAHITTLAL